jgi:2-oxoglutarate/2-oxoacid ferredoxin oxidoreductase subunit alpha
MRHVLSGVCDFRVRKKRGCLKGELLKADPRGVRTGVHFLNGDHACAEGALSVGCRFVAGYPITPSTEIVERIASRFPAIGGMFIQMEDEIASSIAIQGAVWAGAKSMTVTSGPGFSLMMEHIGLAVMLETPCVFVDVQRSGPSTGLPTLPAQADMMQARWGSHGDYEIIALCPNSPQECYDLTITAFNLAEEYRVPVMVMMDECIGHMTEKVIIPEAEEIEVTERRYTTSRPGEYLPYLAEENSAPPMVKAGDGYRFHITGLTHDERGYPAMNADSQEKCVRRLVDKIRKNADRISLYEETDVEDADVIVVSYGITSRVTVRAIQMAKEDGVRVGHFRLITAWPFPEKRLRELALKAKAFVMPELNYGQMFFEMQRVIEGRAATYLVAHGGGSVHAPQDIYQWIMQAAAHCREAVKSES